MKKIEVSKLILDFNLYPRVQVDSQHAGYMVESLRAGLELPPVVVDEKSLRVIDGFHRVTAVKRFDKEKGTISAVFKKYSSEGEMFIDAMRYNATHGRTLTQYDRAHCILRAEELKLELDIVAGALSISVNKVKELRVHRIGEFISGGGSSMKGKGRSAMVKAKDHLVPIQLKRTIEHKAGEVLTEPQVKVNEKLSRMNQSFYVHQIVMLIESDLLDKKNEPLMEKLEHLYGLLDGMFGIKAKRNVG